ncbi:hypothetical protein GF312_12970 [Candidatus Poribacteria bacterium]|nr:hypothetical protein [Candidatus Poribacteria bacterium]
MKKNLIPIVLAVFLVSTSYFWMQVLKVHDLPPAKYEGPPRIKGDEAEKFVSMAQELLIDYKEPLPYFYKRDPFARQQLVEEVKTKVDPTESFTLTSIIYSGSNSMVVLNGKILAEGDTIYDKESDLEFMIRSIEPDKIEISDGENSYTLRVTNNLSKNS